MNRKRLRISRADVYKKICRLLRLEPSDTITNGYFDRKQLRVILEYIENREDVRATNKPIDGVPAVRVH
jgi:hypothetical protein